MPSFSRPCLPALLHLLLARPPCSFRSRPQPRRPHRRLHPLSSNLPGMAYHRVSYHSVLSARPCSHSFALGLRQHGANPKLARSHPRPVTTSQAHRWSMLELVPRTSHFLEEFTTMERRPDPACWILHCRRLHMRMQGCRAPVQPQPSR
jgi:hypothetical protein